MSSKLLFGQRLRDLLMSSEFQAEFGRSVGPGEMLKLPWVRGWLSKKVFYDWELKTICSEEHEIAGHGGRNNTFTHNIASLRQNVTMDRGAELTNMTLQFVSPGSISQIKVLHVGPRNMNEIFASLSYGVAVDNISALDLIQVDDFIDSGDMHKMPYASESFDVVILGWVLAYSVMPAQAIREIARVSKSGAIIGVGWDFSLFDYDSPGLLEDNYGVSEISDSDDCQRLFSLHTSANIKVCLRRDAAFPWDGEARKNFLVFKILKSKLDLNTAVVSESQIYLSLSSELKQAADETWAQLNGHAAYIRSYLSTSLENQAPSQDYELLRRNYINFRGVIDDLISDKISKAFPPYFERSKLGSTIFCGEPLTMTEYDDIIRGVEEHGYGIFPRKIPHGILLGLKALFEEHGGPSGRSLIDESNLLASKIVANLCIDQTFLIIAERFLGCLPIIDYVVGMSTKPNIETTVEALHNKRDVDAMYFHFDKDRIKFLKCFIYLSDTDSKNGAHELIPGSHHIAAPRDGRFSESEAFTLTGASPVTINGSAGTIFFVDTHVLHRGLPVLEGRRHVLQFQYSNSLIGAPAKALPLSFFLPEAEKIAKIFPRMFMRYHL